MMNFTLIIQEAEEGGYVGFVPEVPGAFTQGETKEEVRKNIKEVLELLREVRKEQVINSLGTAPYAIEKVEI